MYKQIYLLAIHCPQDASLNLQSKKRPVFHHSSTFFLQKRR